jgi:heme/copper-type cytochrome/quinol oxidase subunit 2
MTRTRFSSAVTLACIAGLLGAGALLRAQQREVSVSGNQFRYTPDRIEVQKDDLVKITFTAGDIAHSFTIDEYRIAKRAGAGQSVTFEFRADRAGEYPYYCNLSQDERCRNMRGTLVVR